MELRDYTQIGLEDFELRQKQLTPAGELDRLVTKVVNMFHYPGTRSDDMQHRRRQRRTQAMLGEPVGFRPDELPGKFVQQFGDLDLLQGLRSEDTQQMPFTSDVMDLVAWNLSVDWRSSR